MSARADDYVAEPVGVESIAARRARILDTLRRVREDLDSNEHEHEELVEHHNRLVEDYERFGRKLLLLEGA